MDADEIRAFPDFLSSKIDETVKGKSGDAEREYRDRAIMSAIFTTLCELAAQVCELKEAVRNLRDPL